MKINCLKFYKSKTEKAETLGKTYETEAKKEKCNF